jgi:hypothetical protein
LLIDCLDRLIPYKTLDLSYIKVSPEFKYFDFASGLNALPPNPITLPVYE